jgi:hypothetical protein
MCYGGEFFGSIILLVAGFVVLHYASKDNSKYLKIAGYILAVAGGLGLFYAAYIRISGSYMPYGGHHMMNSPGSGYGGMMGPGRGFTGPGAMMKFSSECVNQINGKTISPDNMTKFHECMTKNMPGNLNSPMHKFMTERMKECSTKLTGKVMDANTMLDMHNCMMQ